MVGFFRLIPLYWPRASLFSLPHPPPALETSLQSSSPSVTTVTPLPTFSQGPRPSTGQTLPPLNRLSPIFPLPSTILFPARFHLYIALPPLDSLCHLQSAHGPLITPFHPHFPSSTPSTPIYHLLSPYYSPSLQYTSAKKIFTPGD